MTDQRKLSETAYRSIVRAMYDIPESVVRSIVDRAVSAAIAEPPECGHATAAPRTMRPLSNGVIPLVHRGAEALEALLNGDTAAAEAQFGLLTPSETAHLGTAAIQLAAMARRRVNPAVAEHATVYEVSRLPEGHDDYSMFVVTVEHRGLGRWAIVRHKRCLSRDGTWDAEVSEDRDDDDWLLEHRYGLDEALDRARAIAPNVRSNGVSALQLAEQDHG